MDLKVLLPFLIKTALETNQVSPEDVMRQMHKQVGNKDRDQESETVDTEVLEDGETQDEPNEEGAMLETGFKELEIEEAIEKAKQEKKLEFSPNVQTIKTAWDKLAVLYGNNRR